MSPATSFIQRWLPLFYVPSLVVVPLAVKGIPAAEGAKIGAILGVYPQNSFPEGLKCMDMSFKLKICYDLVCMSRYKICIQGLLLRFLDWRVVHEGVFTYDYSSGCGLRLPTFNHKYFFKKNLSVSTQLLSQLEEWIRPQ